MKSIALLLLVSALCYAEDVTSTPTLYPTSVPTSYPTSTPTAYPTDTPTTATPTSSPTAAPTSSPTAAPTSSLTATPTSSPTATPTSSPTLLPTSFPTPSEITLVTFSTIMKMDGVTADDFDDEAEEAFSIVTASSIPGLEPEDVVVTSIITTNEGTRRRKLAGEQAQIEYQISAVMETFTDENGEVYTDYNEMVEDFEEEMVEFFADPDTPAVFKEECEEQGSETITSDTPIEFEEPELDGDIEVETVSYETDDKNDDDGLSGGAIAGIVIGVIVGIGLIGCAVWYFTHDSGRETQYSDIMRKNDDIPSNNI